MKIALEGTQLIRHPCIQIYVEIFRLFQRTDRQNRDPRGRQKNRHHPQRYFTLGNDWFRLFCQLWIVPGEGCVLIMDT